MTTGGTGPAVVMRVTEIVIRMVRCLRVTKLTRSVHPAIPILIRIRERMRVIAEEIRIAIIRPPGFIDDRAHGAG